MHSIMTGATIHMQEAEALFCAYCFALRGQSLIGRTATLEQPIAEGRGRIRLDDTMWSVQGPDLPVGTRVRVTASNGRDLTVEAV